MSLSSAAVSDLPASLSPHARVPDQAAADARGAQGAQEAWLRAHMGPVFERGLLDTLRRVLRTVGATTATPTTSSPPGGLLPVRGARAFLSPCCCVSAKVSCASCRPRAACPAHHERYGSSRLFLCKADPPTCLCAPCPSSAMCIPGTLHRPCQKLHGGSIP